MHITVVNRTHVLTHSQKLDFTAVLHSKSFYRKYGTRFRGPRIPRNHASESVKLVKLYLMADVCGLDKSSVIFRLSVR